MNDNEVILFETSIEQNKEALKMIQKDNEFLKEVILAEKSLKKFSWVISIIIVLGIIAFCFVMSYDQNHTYERMYNEQSQAYERMHKETLEYFSQYEYYSEVTITQEQETDGGNNNYFANEATYNEAQK